MISMFLTQRIVSDPPHIRDLGKRVGSIDYLGFALIALGLGALELVLDKGQEEDWFASNYILGATIFAAVTLTVFVWWEWRHKHPIVDVRLFRDKSFATSNLMMLVLGLQMYGTTVLLPQYTQTMMGYSASLAGMALSPGGFVVILLLPLVGVLVSKVDARNLLAFGFSVISLSLFYMAFHLYTGLDFRTVVLLRVYQSIGMAFMFVPINTLSYVGVPLEKNNAVSGIVNLARNMGGDIGIALVTTLLARRSQVHQVQLISHADPFSMGFDQRVRGLAATLERAGTPAAEATHRATGFLYRMLQQQAMTLSYIDVLYVLGCGTAGMLPLLLLLKRNKTGQAAQMGH